MNRWPTKPLGDLVLPTEQRDPIENPVEEFSYVDIAGVDNKTKTIAATKRIVGADAPSRARKVIRKGDVIVSMVRPNLNAVALVPASLDNQICSTGFSVLRPSEKVLSGYLFAFVRSPFFIESLVARTTGANYPAVNDGEVKDVPVPVPPPAEQERIVKLLDEADELRKLRGQADRRTTALIPALFHEMFGDPATNPRRWSRCLFTEVGKLDRGRSKNRPRDEPSLYGGKYPFIQTGDVANSNGQITTHSQTYTEKGLAQSRMWPAGTLVITIAANIGKTAILAFPACFPDSMVGFVPGENVLVDYVHQWLVTMESHLEEVAPQMAQKNINLKILSELTIPVPPLSLQKKFAQRVTEIRELEAGQAASRLRLENLFQSLLHRAFAGEL
jgi:type I restriction enzyme, S subunit